MRLECSNAATRTASGDTVRHISNVGLGYVAS